MKQGIAIGTGLVVLGLASTSQAQVYGPHVYAAPPRVYAAPPPMVGEAAVPPGEILMLVRAAGLTPLTQPARRGPRYVLLASDRMGGQLRVVVSAYDGRILRVRPAHDPRFASAPVRPRGLIPMPGPYYGGPQYAPPHTGAIPQEPPPVISGSRAATPHERPVPPARTTAPREPQHAAAPSAEPAPPAKRARTPLPRPRPATVAADNGAHHTPPRETSPEAETPTPPTEQPHPAPTAGQSRPKAPPHTETQLVPVAPLD